MSKEKTPMQELIRRANNSIDHYANTSSQMVIGITAMRDIAIELQAEESRLIEEHRMMKDALERIKNSMQRFDFRKCARETLNKIEHGK